MPVENWSRSLRYKGSNSVSKALHFEAHKQHLLSNELVHQFCVAIVYKMTIGFTHCRCIKTWLNVILYTDDKEK